MPEGSKAEAGASPVEALAMNYGFITEGHAALPHQSGS